MSQISSMFGHLPGMGTVVETFEQAYCFGPALRYYTGGYIGSTAADPTNTPTWELRPGLVMGKIASTGQWVNYSATATDGSNIAQGVLPIGLRMQDVLSGSNTAKFYGIMVSGGLQASKLIGLDNQARAQMSQNFIFDDAFPSSRYFPYLQFQTKTASYQVLSTDNFTAFDNLGALAGITFTLPAIANGYMFAFRAIADFSITVASTEGDNMVVYNDASADSVAFSTGTQIMGGGVRVYSNAAATKWIVENISAGANTITVVT